jgi:hypothetical protein
MTRVAKALPVIEVAQPCPTAWESMSGNERSRFCAHCGRHVHDLAAMRSDEVIDLVCHEAGRLCLRVTRDEDGRVVTLDYEPALATRTRRFKRWAVAAVFAPLGLGAAWIAMRPTYVITTGIVVSPAARVPLTPPPATGSPALETGCPDVEGAEPSDTPRV